MKKIALFLCITLIYASSCSKDDGDSSSSDKIIGTWGLYKETDGNETFDSETFEFEGNLHYETEVTFLKNKTWYISLYSDYITIEGVEGAPDGSWKNIGGDKYEWTAPAEKVIIELISNNEFIFEDEDGIAYYKRIE